MKKKSEVILIKLNRRLYHQRAIKLAIREYQHLANFSLSQKKDYFQVSLRNIDKDVKSVIKDEFCNYVLFLMKS